MLHEVSTYQIVTISQSGRCAPVRRQQQPRILNRAARKGVAARAHGELLSVKTAHSKSLDCAQSLVCFHLADIGVRVKVDVARIDDGIPVLRSKPSRTAELPHLRPEHT